MHRRSDAEERLLEKARRYLPGVTWKVGQPFLHGVIALFISFDAKIYLPSFPGVHIYPAHIFE